MEDYKCYRGEYGMQRSATAEKRRMVSVRQPRPVVGGLMRPPVGRRNSEVRGVGMVAMVPLTEGPKQAPKKKEGRASLVQNKETSKGETVAAVEMTAGVADGKGNGRGPFESNLSSFEVPAGANVSPTVVGLLMPPEVTLHSHGLSEANSPENTRLRLVRMGLTREALTTKGVDLTSKTQEPEKVHRDVEVKGHSLPWA